MVASQGYGTAGIGTAGLGHVNWLRWVRALRKGFPWGNPPTPFVFNLNQKKGKSEKHLKKHFFCGTEIHIITKLTEQVIEKKCILLYLDIVIFCEI